MNCKDCKCVLWEGRYVPPRSWSVSVESFYQGCRLCGLEWAKATLRAYVEQGQPEEFCPGYTARAMCRVASNAIDRLEADSGYYMTSRYGIELYTYMWGV